MPAMLPPDYHGGGHDGSVQNSDLSSKEFDDITDSVKQIHKRYNDKSRILSKISELYLGKHLRIVLDCSLCDPKFGRRERFALTVSRDQVNDFLVGIGRENGIADRCADSQFPVFIESVHVVDDGKGIGNSVGGVVVRLQVVNELPNPRVIHSLYLSVKSSQIIFVGRSREDGKCESVFMISSGSSVREVPDNVIEARSQMMNDLARKNAESQRDRQLLVIVKRLLPELVVWMGQDWVLAGFKECDDLSVQVDDVFVGPI